MNRHALYCDRLKLSLILPIAALGAALVALLVIHGGAGVPSGKTTMKSMSKKVPVDRAQIPRGGQVKVGPPKEGERMMLHTAVSTGYQLLTAVPAKKDVIMANQTFKDTSMPKGKERLQWWYPRSVKTSGKNYTVRWENLGAKGQCLSGTALRVSIATCDAKAAAQTWTATPMTGLHGYKMTPGGTSKAMASKLTTFNVWNESMTAMTKHPLPDVLMKKLGAKPQPGQLWYWDDCSCGAPQI